MSPDQTNIDNTTTPDNMLGHATALLTMRSVPSRESANQQTLKFDRFHIEVATLTKHVLAM
jgi:hypothetical protein